MFFKMVKIMYAAKTLADCLTIVRTKAPSSSVSYSLKHEASGEWGSLYWEDELNKPCWLLVTSEDYGYWTQQFFVGPDDLIEVIEILFREGWTWLK